MNLLSFVAPLALLFVGPACSAQNVVRFRYVLNERMGGKAPPKPYWGMEAEFTTRRTYHTPSTFTETRLFTGDDNRSYRFLRQNGVWYYQARGRWQLFYDGATRRGGILSRFGGRDSVTFVKAVKLRGLALHQIVLEQPGMTSSHQARYYFSPEKGVLLINTSFGLLVRADMFKTPLSEKEIDVL